MKRSAAGLVLALVAVVGHTQTASAPRPVMGLYDLDSATETFCAFDPSPIVVNENILTTAASVTVAGVGAGVPFTNVAVNDQILFSIGGNVYTKTVVTRASASSITVDSVVAESTPATGTPFQYRRLRCSTDGSLGDFSVSGLLKFTIDFNINQQNTTSGIDVRLQCRVGASTAGWKQQFPVLTPPAVTASYTTYTATGGLAYVVPDAWDRCRLGIKLNTTDDGDDLTTNREAVSVTVQQNR